LDGDGECPEFIAKIKIRNGENQDPSSGFSMVSLNNSSSFLTKIF
jgi:hypothetical protein